MTEGIAVTRPSRIPYGDHREQFGDLWMPDDDGRPLPVVVLVHGGFWRQQYALDLMDGLAESSVDRGYAVWNIEYRRVGGAGGYPQTLDDVSAAVDHLATLGDDRLDLGRVAIVGHSAGGHLAVWAASRGSLPAGGSWAAPVVQPMVAVSLAGVLDLVAAAESGVGGSACPDLLGGAPDAEPHRYALASPIALLPCGILVVGVHGTRDDIVPTEQSERYVRAAKAAGDPAELAVIEGADHFDVIDATNAAWTAVLDRLVLAFG
ncbi:alpha/beta hydrolase family protein [Actinospongicola halichondriae]|uniref:alpha/beta hydrolase family protein n=1 Tax=Actinospongicola halichondriae TaxID=3236844 RepID=UPI003D3D4276